MQHVDPHNSDNITKTEQGTKPVYTVKYRVYLKYKSLQIPRLKYFTPPLAVVFVQPIEASSSVENEDVVGAAPAGDASATTEWSTNNFIAY